jgi:hypothetical protein
MDAPTAQPTKQSSQSTNRPWLAKTMLACADCRQNWYTMSVDAPQLASIRQRSIRNIAPSSRRHSRLR